MLLKRFAGANPFTRCYGTTQSGRILVSNITRKASCTLALVMTLVVAASLPATPQDRARSAGNAGDSLKREVRHELVMLPYYGVFDNLAYRINGSEVELFGQVTRPTLKNEAEQVVKRIEGVDKVINNIEVLPLSPNDDRIRLAAYKAIYGHPALNRYGLQAVPPIHIIVKNGNLTLEGVVANEADKNIAGIQASSVPGAFKVTNNLRVES